MPRLRARLDQLQAEANQTLAEAQQLIASTHRSLSVAEKALLQLVAKVSTLTVLATELVAETLDGVTAEGEVEFMGKTLPVRGRLTIRPREDP